MLRTVFIGSMIRETDWRVFYFYPSVQSLWRLQLRPLFLTVYLIIKNLYLFRKRKWIVQEFNVFINLSITRKNADEDFCLTYDFSFRFPLSHLVSFLLYLHVYNRNTTVQNNCNCIHSCDSLLPQCDNIQKTSTT